MSFSSIEIIKPVLASVQCLVGQIQIQNPILVVATDQMPVIITDVLNAYLSLNLF